jgi:GT2 family glycosyltransferase
VRPLSVVIPSHNRPDLLQLCLASVYRHKTSGTEVIVVDDASPDHAASAVAAHFRGVRVLRLSRQRGFCVAANAGVRAASHECIELLNDDTQVTAGWAEAALAALNRPRVGAVAPLVLIGPEAGTDGPIVDSAGDGYFVGGIARKRGHGVAPSPEYLQPARVFGASASSAFYRREAFLAVGGFPASFGAYFEDVDLAFRLHRAGWQILYEPASRVLHRVSSSYGPPRRDLLAQQSRNEERVFWRNLPRGVLLRALPVHVAVVVAKAWRRWSEGALLPFLIGRLSLLSEVRELCRDRRGLGRVSRPGAAFEWGVDARLPPTSASERASATCRVYGPQRAAAGAPLAISIS